jgi:hypothetical protein
MMDQHWRWLAYAWFVCVFITMGATVLDYGLTWDEEDLMRYGAAVVQWYTSVFHDDTALTYSNLFWYGGFFEGLAHVATRISPFGVYETHHVVIALFGYMGLIGAYKLGAHFSGPPGGVLSALFLTLMPVYYGHLFNNPKDIPFATLSVWAVYYLFRSYACLPRVPNQLLVKLGITLGLTLGVRVGGGLLFIYLTILWAGWLVLQYAWQRGEARARISACLAALGRSFLSTLLLAWAVMLVAWPWAQRSPLLRPLKALYWTARFPWYGVVLFNGRYIADVPWTYLPTWFGIQLPEFYMLAFAIGGVLAVAWVMAWTNTPAYGERLLKVGLLIFMAGFPILAAILLRATVYYGMRQFLFVLPLLAVLAGISVAGLLRSEVSRVIKQGVGGLMVLSAAITVVDMVQLHPYQTVYFNRAIAGGVKAVATRFETDYWGNSYKEGAEWVIAHYRPQAAGKVRVANCSSPFLTGYIFEKTGARRQRFVTVPLEDYPHLFLATTRNACHRAHREGKVLHVVQRKDTPLLYIIEIQSPP